MARQGDGALGIQGGVYFNQNNAFFNTLSSCGGLKIFLFPWHPKKCNSTNNKWGHGDHPTNKTLISLFLSFLFLHYVSFFFSFFFHLFFSYSIFYFIHYYYFLTIVSFNIFYFSFSCLFFFFSFIFPSVSFFFSNSLVSCLSVLFFPHNYSCFCGCWLVVFSLACLVLFCSVSTCV